MRGFYIIFQLIILLVLSLNPVLVIIYAEKLSTLTINSKFIILSSIVILDFLIINLLINTFFTYPINKLEYTIKKFLVGNLKDKEIKIIKSLNPKLNYILLFFSKILHNLKNIKSEFVHGKEIKSEVQIGKEIQEKMINKKLKTIPSLEVIIKTRPAGEIGGDSYDIISVGDNYYIYVGDATGHGVGAGFIMIMVNALISGFAKIFKNGNVVLTKTNEVLKPRVKANLLMSLLLVRWNEKDKKIYMTGAGHEYLLIYKHKSNKCYKIKSGGVALGMISDTSKFIKEKEISFEKNDIIILYSDGITEAINKGQKDGTEEMFGEQRLIDSIEDAPLIKGTNFKSSQSIFNNITIELSKFMGYKHIQLDDITLATIYYKGNNYNKNNDFKDEISNDFITEWKW